MGGFVFVIVIAGLVGLAPVARAAEQKNGSGNDARQKNLCMLYSQDCPKEPLTIQDRMKQLQEEIQKGTSLYTPQELAILEQKLKDAEGVYEFLNG